jgi:7-cyano-7-deazaguanine synthase
MRKLDRNAMVLLSGGLDSVALLHYAREHYSAVEAIAFRYGQPHGIEVTVAQTIANRRGVPFQQLMIGEAVRGLDTLIPAPAGMAAAGVSRAVLPARNLILISCATAHAARRWPGGRFDVLIGSNIDDTAGFADCRADFIRRMADAVTFSVAGSASASVRAPWVEMVYTKADVVRWAASRSEALADIRHAMSCYRGTRCGSCDACALRARAFDACGISDGTVVPGLP